MSGLDAFAKLKARMAKLPAVGARVAKRGAELFSQKAQQAFDAKESVYGVPFKDGSHGPVDLVDEGTLREKALTYTAHGTTIKASLGAVPYARYQMKHGILPQRGKLPADWQAELAKIGDEELTKAAEGQA